ncbi:MAG: DegV family protein [Actinomycetota bacterium]
MPVRIVTDSASDLSDAEASELGIEVVPLSIRFGEEEYTDRQDLSVADFYEKMDALDALPETAAPSPGAFEQAFRKLASEGADAIVCINLSLALSATGQAAQAAAKAVGDDIRVECVDSKSITAGLGTMVIAAATAARGGADADAIVALVEEMQPRTRVFGVLDTLDNLKKGGRIGGAQAMLGTMLSIKPCLDLSSGEVEEAGRQRTRKKAAAWLRSVVEDAGDISELAVIHGQAPDADDFVESLTEFIPRDQIRVSELGAVIGSHGGPRVLGVCFLTSS